METHKPIIFIVIDNDSVLTDLCNYLRNEFGKRFDIITFKTMNESLSRIDVNPDFVILDDALRNENTSEFQLQIKKNNPQIKVLNLTSKQEIGAILEEFFNQPINAINNHRKPLKKIPAMVYRAAVFPIYLLTREFRINKFVAIFILTFITVGIVALTGYFLFVHKA